MTNYPGDNSAYRYPVSIKGVILVNGKVPLLKNERGEFELPGGKLEIHEQPIDCVCREIHEELNIRVKVANIIDSWLYTIVPGVYVTIITYGCIITSDPASIAFSHEHKSLILADLKEINSLNMPEGYKKSITTWIEKSSLTL